MKNTSITLLLFLLSVTLANAAGPIYKDFPVNQQPLPEGLILNYDIVPNDTDLAFENNNGEDTSVSHKKFLLDFYPGFITNKQTSFITYGLGYIREDFDKLNSDKLSTYYSGLYASLFAIGKIDSNWYWNGYLSYGAFSDEEVSSSSANRKAVSFANLAYKKGNQQTYKFGFLYNSNFGNAIILPTVGLSYAWYSYVLDALLPSHISLRKIHSKKLHSIIKAELSYASYYDNKQKDSLEIAGGKIGVIVEYNIYAYLWLQISGNYVGKSQLTWQNDDRVFASLGAGYNMTTGIIWRYLR